jgi:hypothetical protein
MKASKILSGANLDLLIEALDSHIYWQLSDERYRNNGYVYDPGSDDDESAAEIKAANKLLARLERRRERERLAAGMRAASAEGEQEKTPTGS